MVEDNRAKRSIFFAYASRPSLRAETVRQAALGTGIRGVDARTWEDLRIEGRPLIDPILESIDSSDACVAEVSSGNPNVLFEVGFALARWKEVFLAVDETDKEALQTWSSLSLFDTTGRINYGGSADRLANKVVELAASRTPPLMESLLTGAPPREANAVFAPSVPHKFTAATHLERLLEGFTHLRLQAAQDELGLAPLSFYAGQIYRSSAAILHFMSPARLRADIYNARLALLGGIARGLDLPLLMVAEEGYESPLDFKDLLYVYRSSATLTDHVSRWINHLPDRTHSNRRLGRMVLDIELPLRTFGEYVAESEADKLGAYFVHTNEFAAVLDGTATVFVGRKGTGKTATMQQAVVELRADRRNLVIPIKPSSYDLAGLLGLLKRFDDASDREYFLVNLWGFLLTTEIALEALSYAESQPAGVGGDDATAELARIVDELGIARDSDLTSRLDTVISATSRDASNNGTRSVSLSLRAKWDRKLLPPLRRALQRYGRVAVLVDNLDKTWEHGVDYEALSQFLLSLLITSGRLQGGFNKASGDQPVVHLTLTTFLRTDIYDVMRTFAREPDKINPRAIHWEDEELLIKVLEDRFAVNHSEQLSGSELWVDVFPSEVHSFSTRNYLLWRALPRPRDVIFLANAALTTAINRRHDTVLAQDFSRAEQVYSRFAIEALLVESEAQGFDLEEMLFGFAGLDSTLTETQLHDALHEGGADSKVVNWLIETSFLGLETRDGSFVYVEGKTQARKKFVAARRLADRLNRPLRYRVHPAFRPDLDVRDDDIHSAVSGEFTERE